VQAAVGRGGGLGSKNQWGVAESIPGTNDTVKVSGNSGGRMLKCVGARAQRNGAWSRGRGREGGEGINCAPKEVEALRGDGARKRWEV
jgi:hypothetical protein